jgi:hypothetical protein
MKTEAYEIAIKAEARAHAEFFGVAGDAEHIAARERLSRANVACGYVDYLTPFLPEVPPALKTRGTFYIV